MSDKDYQIKLFKEAFAKALIGRGASQGGMNKKHLQDHAILIFPEEKDNIIRSANTRKSLEMYINDLLNKRHRKKFETPEIIDKPIKLVDKKVSKKEEKKREEVIEKLEIERYVAPEKFYDRLEKDILKDNPLVNLKGLDLSKISYDFINGKLVPVENIYSNEEFVPTGKEIVRYHNRELLEIPKPKKKVVGKPTKISMKEIGDRIIDEIKEPVIERKELKKIVKDVNENNEETSGRYGVDINISPVGKATFTIVKEFPSENSDQSKVLRKKYKLTDVNSTKDYNKLVQRLRDICLILSADTTSYNGDGIGKWHWV